MISEPTSILIRDLDNIKSVPTSHAAGLRKVLLANQETDTNITQIAKTTLMAGEVAAEHVHPDMEEYFLFEQGEGTITLNGIPQEIMPNRFVRIPCGISHEIKAVKRLVFYTIGVKR